MESIISTFHIDWKIIIAQAINFSIVFVVLYIYALKPLSKLMSERSEKIEQGIADAKKNKEMLEKARVEYDEVINQARREAEKMWQTEKKEIEEKKMVMMEDAKKEVVKIVDGGKKMLESEKIKMLEDAKKEVVALAMLAVEKLLKDNSKLNNLEN